MPPSRSEMLAALHRMRLELEASSSDDVDDDSGLLERNGSVRGRRLHVLNVVRSMRLRMQLKRDYIKEETGLVVVYMTSCGILRSLWERCKEAVDLLQAHGIRTQIRDLNMDGALTQELLDRMQILQNNRDLVFASLPVIYVDGKYFGNGKTLLELNERKELKKYLEKFQGRGRCSFCGGCGYVVCGKCDGGKRSRVTPCALRCAACDRNGITPCGYCRLSERANGYK
ncbi:unnamed protein product [Caenorhabditis auriculariae]|uniref:Glutaredoxin domain-containing protein n=1 Tax=Caenorhabditis auriculariae TaxID=2777116 RepID=A0A8S1HLF7_9PELO|nr:unnamed protein product [Caenorhabditis auriculariae]